MTGGARDVLVARQNLVVKQKLAKPGLGGIEANEIAVAQRRGQVLPGGGGSQKQGEEKRVNFGFCLRHAGLGFALAMLLAHPVRAELETARDLMEAGRFEEAREALWPAARSGNAEAEELIGVMYALGLGVEKDEVRAFEWYLRAAMKGHAGAQSGVGWYYEVGIGLPAPDLVRAHLWYVLSTIGGDPDAAISQEEVRKKMTAEEIEQSHILINDYRVWLYPFR